VIIYRNTLGRISSLVYSNESICEFEHVISKGDDDKLSILGSLFDVMSDDGNISEVKRGVNFVHEVQRRRLEDVKGEYQSKRT